MRRRARDDDKGPADGADFVAGDDVLVNVSGPIEASGNGMNVADAAAKKPKKQKIGLPWDINNLYPIEIPDWVGKGHHSGGGQGGPNEPFAADEEDDEEEEEQNFATRQRLRAADKRTQNMTREEYVFFSECRQASFTYRKNKRFREWAGFQYFPDSKPNEDVIDMFGFLTLDIVHRLTEEALRVKENEERSRKQTSEKEDSTDNNDNKATGDSEDPGNASTANTSKKRKREERGLFQPPEETRSPVEPRHIHEAFRRSQMTPNRTIMMLLHEGRPRRVPLQFVSFFLGLWVYGRSG